MNTHSRDPISRVLADPGFRKNVDGLVQTRRLPADASGGHVYGAAASAARPPADDTARVMPRRDGVAIPITTLFLDIGGVLLTDGWDRHARERAATRFKLELAEMEDRHSQIFDTYEEGKLTLEDYLSRVIFYRKRPFTRDQFRRFVYAQSKPYPEMLELIARLKVRHGLKIVVVSNEARELNAYRIRKFKLDAFVDAFISSCYVRLRKPDADIFRLALDIAQTPARQVIYIENTPMFVQIAEELGIRGILHTDYRSTCAKLASFGLPNNEGVIH